MWDRLIFQSVNVGIIQLFIISMWESSILHLALPTCIHICLNHSSYPRNGHSADRSHQAYRDIVHLHHTVNPLTLFHHSYKQYTCSYSCLCNGWVDTARNVYLPCCHGSLYSDHHDQSCDTDPHQSNIHYSYRYSHMLQRKRTCFTYCKFENFHENFIFANSFQNTYLRR